MLRRLLLLLPLLIFMPGIALAADLFTPVGADKSMVVLGSIFGGLGVFAGSADPMGEGIKIFNGCVLVIGGVLVAYTIFVGTLGTAHDGEMLGKKFSSVWIPIRTAAGTALVLPIINGTYCLMQAIVGWLIVQGIGLADTVWIGYTTGSNMQFVASGEIASSSARALGYSVFNSLACMETITQVNKDLNASGAGSVVTNNQIGVQSLSPMNSNVIVFGANVSENGLGADSCGSVLLPLYDRVKTETGISGIADRFVDGGEMLKASLAINKANHEATKQMIVDLNVLAKKMVTEKVVITASEIETAISKYENTVNIAAAKEIGNLGEFKTLAENASKDGWFLAGAFYTKMAWFADSVHRSTTNVGIARPPSPTAFSSPIFEGLINPYNDLLKKTSKTDSGALPGGFGVNAETGVEDSDGAETLFAKVFKWNPFVPDDGEHPLMALKRMGNWLLGIYAATVITTIGLAGASGGWVTEIASQVTTIGTFSLGKALNFGIGLLVPLLTPMLAVGIILSYVLPMMPFFLWFGATLGWLVMCIEALLAAPMWAVMHLSPQGDDMVGTAGQGYRLVLSLVLRPVLMIFGLIASFVIIQVIGQLLSEIFFGAFTIGQSESNILVRIIGYLIVAPLLYAWTMFVLIKKSFSMIHVIPDEMLKWFGGVGSNHLGDFANTVGGEGGGAMAGAALMATQARSIGGNVVDKSAGKLRDKQDKSAKQNSEANKGVADILGEKSSFMSGASAKDKMDFAKNYKSASDSFGGEGSIGGEAFAESFARLSESNPNASSGELINEAKGAAHEAMYGKDANAAIAGLTGSNDFSGAEYNAVMGDLSKKSTKLSKAGLTHDQIGEKVSTMLSNAVSRHNSGEKDADGKPLSMAKLVGLESDKLNKEFNQLPGMLPEVTQQVPSEDKTPLPGQNDVQ